MTPGNRYLRSHGARHVVLLFFFFAFMAAIPALAQTPADEPASVVESNAEDDPLGRNNPRGTFVGYIDAVSVQDYARAAEYLDLSHLPLDQREATGEELAKMLQTALDRGGNVPPAVMLSDHVDGRRDDNLDPRLDRLGIIRIGDQEMPVLVERQESGEQMLWLISSPTLQALPEILNEQNRLELDAFIPQRVAEVTWQGVSIGHWLAIIVLGVLAYLVSYLIVAFGALLLRVSSRRRLTDYGEGMVIAFILPVRIYLAVWIFVLAGQYLGIAIVVRQYFGELTVIVASVAILLLAWRLVSIALGFK